VSPFRFDSVTALLRSAAIMCTTVEVAMVDGRSGVLDTWLRDEPRVVIEVSGANVVIRPTWDVDRSYTVSLADVINAASATDTCVVIDPQPIRCDDTFAADSPSVVDRTCSLHAACRAVGAEVASAGIVRLHAEGTVWLIDVSKGRFCQLDTDVDPRFLGDDAWRPVVAVCVTPTRLVALGFDGTRTSARRAHPVPPEEQPRSCVGELGQRARASTSSW
jgi:hypothetical protein